MSQSQQQENQSLERRMSVKFDLDEMNGFYRRVAPLDLDALWAILDEADEEPQR
ncbi:MAG: hypothetical protein AAFQ82_05675 [Myxococcota bacterium]